MTTPPKPESKSGAPTGSATSAVPAWLRSILRCPVCRAELDEREDPARFVCRGADCGRVYPVRDGIPDLLAED